MSAPQFTTDQLNAINARGGTILVSAAAGSGKTAVLVNRIIEHVTDPDNDVSILERLVVTFTKAATAQLKDKLNREIKKAIALDPKNKRLRNQLRDLPRASIATINSFCLEIVKTHFAGLGLSNTVRVADETENKLLMTEIMEQTIEEFYANGQEYGVDDFAAFCDNFAKLRDENLGSIFIDLYNDLYSRMDGLELLSRCADKLEATADEPFLNPWGVELKNQTRSYVSAYKKLYADIIPMIEATDGLQGYVASFYDELEIMDSLDCKEGEVWDFLKQHLDIDYARQLLLMKYDYYEESRVHIVPLLKQLKEMDADNLPRLIEDHVKLVQLYQKNDVRYTWQKTE